MIAQEQHTFMVWTTTTNTVTQCYVWKKIKRSENKYREHSTWHFSFCTCRVWKKVAKPIAKVIVRFWPRFYFLRTIWLKTINTPFIQQIFLRPHLSYRNRHVTVKSNLDSCSSRNIHGGTYFCFVAHKFFSVLK